MSDSLNKIKILRKLTNVGVMKCRQILNECSGELTEALKRLQSMPAAAECFEGDLYVACIRTRFGVCLFRLYANANIYNNRFVWNLRQLLNHILSCLKYDSEVVLNSKQIDGIFIRSCVFLKIESFVCSLYLHDRICDFIWKKGTLLLLSVYNLNDYYINWLGVEICKQILFNAVVNNSKTLESLLRCSYIRNEKLNVIQFIRFFQLKFKCIVNFGCALLIC
ncbi:elongation factor EF-Ts [Candidatus Hodgkinia cicadicola]|nr:elongation factor EF-Ts [Candidatus Hodgkinia cicadicola]